MGGLRFPNLRTPCCAAEPVPSSTAEVLSLALLQWLTTSEFSSSSLAPDSPFAPFFIPRIEGQGNFISPFFNPTAVCAKELVGRPAAGPAKPQVLADSGLSTVGGITRYQRGHSFVPSCSQYDPERSVCVF